MEARFAFSPSCVEMAGSPVGLGNAGGLLVSGVLLTVFGYVAMVLS